MQRPLHAPFSAPARRGSILLATVVMISAMLVLVLATTQFTAQVHQQGANLADKIEALYLAETGIAEAAAALIEDADGNVGSIAAPVRFGDGLFWVEATPTGTDQWHLEVTAMRGRARVAIDALVERAYGLPYGFFSTTKMKIKKRAFFDSWDPADGQYEDLAVNSAGGRLFASDKVEVATNESLKIDNDVAVFGDLIVGPTGTVDWKDKKKAESYLSGEIIEADEPLMLPPIEVPPAPPSVGKLKVKALGGVGYDLELGPGDIHYDKLEIKKQARVRIIGPSRIIVDDDVKLEGLIDVDGAGGPVAIYAPRMKIKKDSVVSTLSGSASELFLLLHSEGKNKKPKAKIAGEVTAVIYGPDAHVSIKHKKQAGALFGAVLAYSIKQKDLRFHYDESLERIPSHFIKVGARVFTISWNVSSVPTPLLTDHRDPFQVLGVEREEALTPGQAWQPGGSSGALFK